MVSLTVFTPTYNRADLLPVAYHALKNQTSKDFLWMIIDDGSTDDTEKIVREWIDTEKDFEIRYYKKENGGLHTGYNKAIEMADTELMVCIDSDDYMPENAVERILTIWREKGSSKVAGLIGLDVDEQGNPISGLFPDVKTFNLIKRVFGEYDFKSGDTKLVVRTELYKSVAPMPVFKGEKNFNPQLMHLKISLNFDFIPVNEAFCVVNYQDTGMTSGILKQFYNSPNSFAEYRKFQLSIPNSPLKFRLRYSTHYVSSCILAHKKHFVADSPRKCSTVLSLAPGFLLSRYIKYKNKG